MNFTFFNFFLSTEKIIFYFIMTYIFKYLKKYVLQVKLIRLGRYLYTKSKNSKSQYTFY